MVVFVFSRKRRVSAGVDQAVAGLEGDRPCLLCLCMGVCPALLVGLLLSHSICRAWPSRLQAQGQGCPACNHSVLWHCDGLPSICILDPSWRV